MKASGFAQRLCRAYCAIAAIALSCAACTTQLAPNYDASLASGIHDVNTEIMGLYSTTSLGTSAKTFASRVQSYDEIIGKLDALTLQSQSRPVPDVQVAQKIESYLKARSAFPLRLTQEQEQKLQSAETNMAQLCASKLKLATPKQPSLPPGASDGDDTIPSAMALRMSSRTLTLLRNKDCAQGLKVDDVWANKGQVEHFMYEAITYEDFLNRQ